MAQGAGADLPMRRVADMFQPLSRPAEMIHDVSILVLIICGVIFLIVSFMLFYVVIRFRKKATDNDQEPPQIYGSTNIELAWTVIPIIITVLLILVTSRTIGEIQNAKMPDEALRIRVVGHQWWWEVHYLKPDGNGGWKTDFITANEIHIPLSDRDPAKARPTHLLLQSADVIHSFWVPQLAGKTDLVPNKDNELWLDPYEIGVYFGNCAEYCGTQHANMLLRVIVDVPENYEKWAANQRTKPAAPQTPLEIQGQKDFFANSCVSCHKIDGTVSVGIFGPDLTKLMTRQTIGAGVAPLDHKNLHAWVKDPQDLKVGCLMPNMQLADSEVDSITAYLETLK